MYCDYIDNHFLSYKNRPYLKNIDYNIRYAYSVYMPSNFAYLNYSNSFFSYYYKYTANLHDNYFLISHDFTNVHASYGSFTNKYEVFNFNSKNSMIYVH